MKLRLLTITLTLVLLAAGCSELLPFRSDSVPSVEEGLPGIWQSQYIVSTKGEYMVRDGATGVWHTIEIDAVDEEIDRDSPNYAIVKFFDNEITLLGGGKLYTGVLAHPYPYRIVQDSVVISNLLKPKFSEGKVYVSNMSRNEFDLVHHEEGVSESGDTTCAGLTTTIRFQRLR